MSRRMVLAIRLARLLVRPFLARTSVAFISRFDNAAPVMLHAPRFLRHLVRARGGLELHWIGTGRAPTDRLIYYIHGGAFVAGSPRGHSAMLGRIARLCGCEVCAPRYRLVQAAAFPAGIDDVRAGWEELMRLGWRSGQIVIGGDSAGGGLAFALLAHLLARGDRPAGLFAFSPWVDLTLSGDSLTRFGTSEPLLPVERIGELRDLYLAGTDPADPRASPLFADFPDPPPILIQCGAEEALLSDSERMAAHLRDSGGEVQLDLWPGCLHVWQIADGWLPEARAALREVGAFVQASFARASR